MTLFEFLALVLEHRRRTVFFPIFVGVVTGVIVLLMPRHFTTTVSFKPQSSASTLASLNGLAQQFGVTLPGQLEDVPPAFYADLIESPEVLRAIALEPFSFIDGRDTSSAAFVDLYEIHESTAGRTIFEAIKRLRNDVIDVSANRQTAVVTVEVTTKWPRLSRLMAERILEKVDEFNTRVHRSRAAAEFVFMSERLDTARTELRAAEGALQGFLEKNRDFKNDPRLAFQYDRLLRDVTMRQGVFTTVTQAVEQARIESARTTPSITLVERPRDPLRADRRYVPYKVIGAAALCFVLAIVSLLAAAYARIEAARDEGSARTVRGATQASLRDVASWRWWLGR